MILFDLMMETPLGFLILCIGLTMGLFSFVYHTWKEEIDAIDYSPLTFKNRKLQICSRLLFVIAVVCCLFVDFPSRADYLDGRLNWLMFPLCGLFGFVVTWFISFLIVRCLISVFNWVIGREK